MVPLGSLPGHPTRLITLHPTLLAHLQHLLRGEAGQGCHQHRTQPTGELAVAGSGELHAAGCVQLSAYPHLQDSKRFWGLRFTLLWHKVLFGAYRIGVTPPPCDPRKDGTRQIVRLLVCSRILET